MNRAVFLDRDNTLIHNDGDLGDPQEVKLVQGAASAVASLQGLGYKVVVVSNQGGVARGKFSEQDVEATNQRVNDLVKTTSGASIDRFYYCPYHPEGTVEKYKREHPWRKPGPGMLLQAASDLGLDMNQCWMIGDQIRDIEAGVAAGVRTVLLSARAGQQPPLRQGQAATELMGQAGQKMEVKPDFVARNLIEAVRVVAQQRRPEGGEDLLWNESKAGRGKDESRGGNGQSWTKPGVKDVGQQASGLRAGETPPRVSGGSGGGGSGIQAAGKQVEAVVSGAGPKVVVDIPVEGVRREAAGGVVASSVAVEGQVAATKTLKEQEVVVKAGKQENEPAGTTEAEQVTTGELFTVGQTLRQILQELRNQRQVGQEFSYTGVFAIVLQMLAGVCLLAALWMGSADGMVFLRWLGCGIMVQLATIAVLMFRR